MFKKYSKTFLTFFVLSIGTLIIVCSCNSMKKISKYVKSGVSVCDTIPGIYLRDFTVDLVKNPRKIWKIPLNKGTKYKFTVFEYNLYTNSVKTKRTINSIISIYYGNINEEIGVENFINSTSKTEEHPNCFVFDCEISGDYLVSIQPRTVESIDRRYRSMGVLYFLNKTK